mgnify:CR=1 FL=1
MNKPLFRYITVIAILAVMALQGMWFSNSYHLLENELYDKINNAFLEAQLQESSRTSDRFKNNIPNGTVLQLDSTKVRAKNDLADRLILVTDSIALIRSASVTVKSLYIALNFGKISEFIFASCGRGSSHRAMKYSISTRTL